MARARVDSVAKALGFDKPDWLCYTQAEAIVAAMNAIEGDAYARRFLQKAVQAAAEAEKVRQMTTAYQECDTSRTAINKKLNIANVRIEQDGLKIQDLSHKNTNKNWVIGGVALVAVISTVLHFTK